MIDLSFTSVQSKFNFCGTLFHMKFISKQEHCQLYTNTAQLITLIDVIPCYSSIFSGRRILFKLTEIQ